MRYRHLSVALILAFLVSLVPVVGLSEAQAQILMVTGSYRVVSLDKENQRIGITLPDADTNKRLNWIYVRFNTKTFQRHESQGWFRDEELDVDELFQTIEPGSLLRVHGGRRWDKAISAKKIWL